MKEETLKKYIGKTFGVITVLEVAYETYDLRYIAIDVEEIPY